MRLTPDLEQAVKYLAQKVERAEMSRRAYQTATTEPYRRAAEFDARLLIYAATDVVQYHHEAKMPPLDELLEREHHQTAAIAAGGRV